MGEAQKVPYQELLEQARAAFEGGTDLTVAVEEEFALLDPETLSLVNRFEDVKAAAGGSAVDDHLVGELIASEAEVPADHRRCETFAEASELMGMRRAQLAEITSGLGLALGATGTHPWSRWQDQRIIDTPHYRRNDELLRYVVSRNNTFGLHLHVGIAGADRAIAVHDGLRMFLPHLLALSASSPLVAGVNSGLHSARTEIFTRMFPRCGVPDAYRTWAEFDAYVRLLYETGSIDEHTQIWWSVRPHLAYPTVEIRICDAQPDLAASRALAAFGYGLTAQDRASGQSVEGQEHPDPPPRLIEENMWRAIRYGLSGGLFDLGALEVRPARAELERVAEWIGPVADELGLQLTIPGANAAERQMAARVEEGGTLEETYAEQVKVATADVGAR